MKTIEERKEELKLLAAAPRGMESLHAILSKHLIPFRKLPIGTLMIQAILEYEYAERK